MATFWDRAIHLDAGKRRNAFRHGAAPAAQTRLPLRATACPGERYLLNGTSKQPPRRLPHPAPACPHPTCRQPPAAFLRLTAAYNRLPNSARPLLLPTPSSPVVGRALGSTWLLRPRALPIHTFLGLNVFRCLPSAQHAAAGSLVATLPCPRTHTPAFSCLSCLFSHICLSAASPAPIHTHAGCCCIYPTFPFPLAPYISTVALNRQLFLPLCFLHTDMLTATCLFMRLPYSAFSHFALCAAWLFLPTTHTATLHGSHMHTCNTTWAGHRRYPRLPLPPPRRRATTTCLLASPLGRYAGVRLHDILSNLLLILPFSPTFLHKHGIYHTHAAHCAAHASPNTCPHLAAYTFWTRHSSPTAAVVGGVLGPPRIHFGLRANATG